jgi:hypothetical protein
MARFDFSGGLFDELSKVSKIEQRRDGAGSTVIPSSTPHGIYR